MKITVAVLSYNSEKFVENCLDSILNQKYDLKLIDLIVADDGSQDATKDIVSKWIIKYRCRFNCVSFLSKSVNEGTVLNATSVLEAAQTVWLKMIGADDMLNTDCLRSFKEFDPHGDTAVVFSNFSRFGGGLNTTLPNQFTRKIIKYAMAKRYLEASYLLMLGGGNMAPGAFLNIVIIRNHGGFDSRFLLLEDLPLWDKLLRDKASFEYVEKVLVLYREHEAQTVGEKPNPKLLSDLRQYSQDLRDRGIVGRVFSIHRLYNIKVMSRSYRFKIYRKVLLLINPLNIVKRVIGF